MFVIVCVCLWFVLRRIYCLWLNCWWPKSIIHGKYSRNYSIFRPMPKEKNQLHNGPNKNRTDQYSLVSLHILSHFNMHQCIVLIIIKTLQNHVSLYRKISKYILQMYTLCVWMCACACVCGRFILRLIFGFSLLLSRSFCSDIKFMIIISQIHTTIIPLNDQTKFTTIEKINTIKRTTTTTSVDKQTYTNICKRCQTNIHIEISYKYILL